MSMPIPPFTQPMTQPFYYPLFPQGPYPQGSVPQGSMPQGSGSYSYPFMGFPPGMGYGHPCIYKQFLDCKPDEYHGSTDPNVTLNWLRDIAGIMDACNCEEEMRVCFATRMLKGKFMVWWDSITTHLSRAQMDSITWNQFRDKLCEKYCNGFELNKTRQEFMELKMTRKMTVDELIEQFNSKLRFVSQ